MLKQNLPNHFFIKFVGNTFADHRNSFKLIQPVEHRVAHETFFETNQRSVENCIEDC